MGDRADELARRIARQHRVRIQGNDKAYPLRLFGGAIGCFAVALKQAIEFFDLAPLSFPAHPFAFRRIPKAIAVEDMKARTL